MWCVGLLFTGVIDEHIQIETYSMVMDQVDVAIYKAIDYKHYCMSSSLSPLPLQRGRWSITVEHNMGCCPPSLIGKGLHAPQVHFPLKHDGPQMEFWNVCFLFNYSGKTVIRGNLGQAKSSIKAGISTALASASTLQAATLRLTSMLLPRRHILSNNSWVR